MIPCIMELTTQGPYILKKHAELYKILKFLVNWADIEQDTIIQKLKNLLTNIFENTTTLFSFWNMFQRNVLISIFE